MAFEKRLRLFAGPNGSGKSTIIKAIKEKGLNLGIYLNADDLEVKLRRDRFIDLNEYGLEDIAEEEFLSYINGHSLLAKARKSGFILDLHIANNRISKLVDGSNSYEASLIISFICNKLIERGKKFSFESVMSHPSKIGLLKKAFDHGYKNYLYFISTEDPAINISRVESRVAQGGHHVMPEKIVERYHRSLNLLPEIIPYCYRGYLFDNSGKKSVYILEINPQKEIDNTIFAVDEIPQWVQANLIDRLS